MPCRPAASALLLILAPLMASAWAAPAAQAGTAVFDSPAFWEGRATDFGARKAWEEGAKWAYDGDSVVAWHDGALFGFAQKGVPEGADPSIQARVELGYERRAEMQAVHAAGIFAFNRLDCSAKANYQSLPADGEACRSVEILGKMTGEFEGAGYSVVKMSSDSVCACRKALDRSDSNSDCNIFFGPIARMELGDLMRSGRRGELVEFFRAHQRKNIFGPDQFLMVIGVLLDEGRDEDAKVVAEAAGRRFGGVLNSDQWELLGDHQLRLGQEELAANSFRKASSSLYAEKRHDFNDTCLKK